MANLPDIRRRIRSVNNTRQITRAMKLVSAARLRRAQDRALSGRPYEQRLASLLKSLVTRTETCDPKSGEPRHPLLAQRKEKNILLLVVSGDRGLAGAFNSNIVKAAVRFVNEKAGLGLGFSESLTEDGGAERMQGPVQRIEVQAIGRKGRDFLRRRFPVCKPNARGRGIFLIEDRERAMNKVDPSRATELSAQIIDRYSRGEIDAVYLAFNEFKSVISQRLVVDKVLPVGQITRPNRQQSEELTEEQQQRALQAAKGTGARLRAGDTRATDERSPKLTASKVDYIYEQSPEEIFKSLLPRYVAVQVSRTLLESVAAEHAARMTAMDSATNNASEMNDSLTLAMDRARQAKITKEIIEIVSGAAGQ